jgi:hypothetical protein
VVGAVLVVFLRLWRNLHNPPANEKPGPIPEEIYQTLRTNKKQGNLDEVHAANIVKQAQTRINYEKFILLRYKIIRNT